MADNVNQLRHQLKEPIGRQLEELKSVLKRHEELFLEKANKTDNLQQLDNIRGSLRETFIADISNKFTHYGFEIQSKFDNIEKLQNQHRDALNRFESKLGRRLQSEVQTSLTNYNFFEVTRKVQTWVDQIPLKANKSDVSCKFSTLTLRARTFA